MGDASPSITIEELVEQFHLSVYRFAFRLTGHTADAEDLTQQAFLTAQESLHQLRDPASARSWLFTILRNRFLKDRKRWEPIAAADMQLDLEIVPESLSSIDQIDHELLHRAIHSLPAEYRLVLVMFYFDECRYREIAERLELPIGTVMSRLARAKRYLRRALLAESEYERPAPKPVPAAREALRASRSSPA
ncbi:MAG: sigma-70 family RNA polymerase sigma factor [Planctomycetia bacterium]|jgi:RNA polymerase sigma-70 factor (ECF subfamily)